MCPPCESVLLLGSSLSGLWYWLPLEITHYVWLEIDLPAVEM